MNDKTGETYPDLQCRTCANLCECLIKVMPIFFPQHEECLEYNPLLGTRACRNCAKSYPNCDVRVRNGVCESWVKLGK